MSTTFNPRTAIRREYARRKWTRSQLARTMDMQPESRRVPYTTVQSFLRGDTEITSGSLANILKVLDLRIGPKGGD